ncbi:MAG: sensor histidine kinase, partial [Chitinophagaceae bacterium]
LIEQIDQLAKIAGDFSQFANIAQMQPEKLSLNQSLLSVIQLHQHQDLQIHWLEEEKEAFVWADKIQLSRLFTNLIKNACEVERLPNVSPTIEVKLYKKDSFFAIAITDNGMGITNEQLPRIFSPNFTTKTSGTGLGLAICKGIVEKHNGHIQFVSQPGVGTTFTVFLPVYFQ